MSIQPIIQDVSSVASATNVLVLAVGYFLLIRLYRAWFQETQRERVAGGRPQVVVAVDHTHLPEVGLVVSNPTGAPAKDISFDFSAPVESSDGYVLSDLPFLRKGLPFLEPDGKIECRWDSLPSLAPYLEEKGLEDGIMVTVRHKDLAEERYEAGWNTDPLLFEGGRIENSDDMTDPVGAVGRVSESLGVRSAGGDRSRGG